MFYFWVGRVYKLLRKYFQARRVTVAYPATLYYVLRSAIVRHPRVGESTLVLLKCDNVQCYKDTFVQINIYLFFISAKIYIYKLSKFLFQIIIPPRYRYILNHFKIHFLVVNSFLILIKIVRTVKMEFF